MTSDDLGLTPDMIEALAYGAIAVVVGLDPDRPDELVAQTYQLVPSDGRERRLMSPNAIAAALRRIADELESDGAYL